MHNLWILLVAEICKTLLIRTKYPITPMEKNLKTSYKGKGKGKGEVYSLISNVMMFLRLSQDCSTQPKGHYPYHG